MRYKFLFLFVISLLVLSSFVSAGFLSASRVPVTSDFNDLNKPDGLWVIGYSSGQFSTDQIKTFSTSEAKQDFTISLKDNKNYCDYSIEADSTRKPIQHFEIKDSHKEYNSWDYAFRDINVVQFVLEKGIAPSSCDLSLGWMVSYSEGILTDELDIYCYDPTDTLATSVGNIDPSKIVASSKVQVDVEGKQSQSAIISNDNSGDGVNAVIGNDIRVRFEGLLSSGEQCPGTTGRMVARNTAWDGNWRVINKASYQEYDNWRSDTSKQRENLQQVMCYEGISIAGCSKRSRSAVQTEINNLADNSIREESIEDKYPSVLSSSTNSGTMRLDLSRLIRFPYLTFFIDTDYIEVNIPTGKPQLQKTTFGKCVPDGDVVFTEGRLEDSTFTIGVKNTGSSDGSFQLRVDSCSSNFNAGDTDSFTLTKGQVTTKDLFITGTADPGQTNKGQCTIVLEELNTGEEDSCNINTEVSEVASCREGDQWCSLDGSTQIIKECIGGKEVVSTRCTSSQVCDSDSSGNKVCVESGNYDGKCKNCFQWFFGNKVGIQDECQSTILVERKWYNPVSLILPAGGLSQDNICPFVLIFYGLSGLVGIVLFLLAFSVVVKLARGGRIRKNPIQPKSRTTLGGMVK